MCSHAAGIAISSDGKTLVVANYYDDTMTVFTGGLGNWSKGTELDLPRYSKPAQIGVPRRISFWAAVKGTGASATAYISASAIARSCGEPQRTPTVTTRIKVVGSRTK